MSPAGSVMATLLLRAPTVTDVARKCMDIVEGLPAHALLLHFVVVLVPLTALLVTVCGLWPAGRQGQLMWATLISAIITMVLTPITTTAGLWLYSLRTRPSPILREHAARGSTMIYFSAALLVVAVTLAVLGVRERRSGKPEIAVKIVMGIVVVAVGISSLIQIYRVGDTGAQSVWHGEIGRLEKASKP